MQNSADTEVWVPTVGSRVTYGKYSYEVAEIKKFPHGLMVGIYDEPPSKHIDYLNLTSVRPA